MGYPRQREPSALHHASDIPQPLLAAASFYLSAKLDMQQTRLLVGLSGEHESRNLCPPLPEWVSWWIAVNGVYDIKTLFNITY